MSKYLWAILGGAATTIAVVLVCALVTNLTGFDPLSFSWLVVLPIGAIFGGAAASYGFYYVAHRLDLRPNAWIIVWLVANAAAAFIAAYFLEYLWLELEDGTRVAELATFGEYLEAVLGSQELRVGRALQNAMPLGQAGYWLAGWQLVAFAAAGSWAWFKLRDSLHCRECKKYLRLRGQRVRFFGNSDALAEYYDDLFAHDPASEEFERRMTLGSKEAGSLRLQLTASLHDCEGCSNQLWMESVNVFDGKQWRKEDRLARGFVFDARANVARFVKRPEVLSGLF